MRTTSVPVGQREVTLCELSAAHAIAARREGELLGYRLCAQGVERQTAYPVAHNAALCAYSLYENGTRLFYSAQGCLNALTLAELAQCTKRYHEQFETQADEFDEGGINRSLQTGGDGHGVV